VTTAVTVLSMLVLGAPALAEDSKEPIKLTLHDWTGQLITTQLMGEALKNAGLNVEYVPADYLAQFAGLKTGDLHVAMEMWETTGREAMDEATATGQVENLGETGMLAVEEWWYPAYMKEKCPGLPDWEALKNCAEQFSTAETSLRGGPCRNRRRTVCRARVRLSAQGAHHPMGLRSPLGADQVRRRMDRIPQI
jgi:glycine betaine/proline transport system substrate-binding protein